MTKLETINAEDLQNRTYKPTPFLVEELLPEGLHILAGAPKIGKSWLALWLCLCVSQGQPLWNFAVTQGEVLYLSLEDSFQRIQTRLFDLTEDAPPTLHFAIMADTLKRGLEQQIEQFLTDHPATKLVVIDTLQRVRSTGGDSNLYANDYQDVGLLKQLADRHHIAILLIHHLRKLHDDDPMNMCGFLPRQRVCVRRGRKSPRCTDVRATQKNADTIRRPNAEKPRRSGEKSSRLGGASIAFG